ncbi:glycerophosphodiester phosphodiesterase [Dysgonomonas sp. 521]|uniref:glycerophosphodiester phosphodiesterase n=1 Tax=Dysgonomonas sp. 521 TaxID=2302932 RepID=UPI0013D6BA41|nr:glycerophosphodiester phosphodiesterase [Dysgonomonas sp. 521]NDV94240.1 glycerophosphodiester phosphodiesterase [Dysgonomonas sp. 521]
MKIKMRTKVILLTALIVFIAVLSQVITNCLIQNKISDTIIVTGHRGAAHYAPENTVASIEKALELNVNRIEIDIQRTKDSIIVVSHDIDIDRTTNGTGKIIDLEYSEILQYDILDKDGNIYKIPTLEQAIQAIDGKSKLLIEIKEGNDYYQSIEKQVVDLLHAYNATEWCIIHSFNDDILSEIRKYDKNIELHKLFLGRIPFTNIIFSPKLSNLNKPLYESLTEFSSMYNLTDRSLIKKIHDKGKRINVWTVNDSVEIKQMIEKGVDGIITDDPKLILK